MRSADVITRLVADPRLTTRREGGHLPVRIVMSRTLRLPEDANLWDVSAAPTIVMTQKGAREDFQVRQVLRRFCFSFGALAFRGFDFALLM